MNFYFYYLIALIIKHVSPQFKIIKLQFEKYPINLNNINSIKSYNYFPKPDDKIKVDKDFCYRLLTDDVYFNLTLGTPPQVIPAIWNMHQYSFKFYNSSFNINKSSSFKKLVPTFRYNFDESSDAILCQDKFYFTDDNNFSFTNNLNFVKFEQGDKNYSFVGLQIPDYLADELLTFPRALKLNKIINNYIFFIYYNKYQSNDEIMNYNGFIYFGDYPYNIKEFKNEFSEEDFYEIKAAFRSGLVHWDILFDNIYFGDNDSVNIQKKQVELHANMRLSIGTEEYKEYISKNFFDKYINESLCELKIVLNNTDYEYYECINNLELFEINKFPTLRFEIREINFIFYLNYQDLFFTHNNKIYFGIFFDRFFKLKYTQRWKLGSALFKKYLLVFNQDSKTIGIYKKPFKNDNIDENNYNSDKNKKNEFEEKKNDSIKIFFKIMIIICLILLLLMIILFIKKYIGRNTKINDSKKINFVKGTKAHESKNKNIVHQYYELGNSLIQ